MNKTENLEEIWSKYSSLFVKAFGDSEGVSDFLDVLGERIVMCPGAHKADMKYCEPGGLMKMSIDTAITMKKIAESLSLNVESASILRVALSHELGKIGSLEEPYFLDQDSDWHREKLGAHYKFNEKLERTPVSHMSCFLLNTFGLKLNWEETRALMTSGGPGREENKPYGYTNSPLQSLVQAAKLFTVNMSS